MSTFPLRLLDDRIAIKRNQQPDVTEGGVLVPSVAKEDRYDGVVIACGPGRWEHGMLIPMPVQVNDHVVFEKYNTSDFVINGETYVMTRPNGIVGVSLEPPTE